MFRVNLKFLCLFLGSRSSGSAASSRSSSSDYDYGVGSQGKLFDDLEEAQSQKGDLNIGDHQNDTGV